MRSKLFTAAAVLALVVPAVAQAQTATVTASATVQASLTATTTNQLNFGTLTMGQTSIIGTTDALPLSAPGVAGRGQVHVQHNSNVNVTGTFPLSLLRADGLASLAFVPSCGTSSASGGSATGGTCSSFALTAAAPGTVQSTYILVGGTVTGSGAAGVGTFSGDVVFTLTSTN
jgi:hypothetical protein